jgi:hypothetical protein
MTMAVQPHPAEQAPKTPKPLPQTIFFTEKRGADPAPPPDSADR